MSDRGLFTYVLLLVVACVVGMIGFALSSNRLGLFALLVYFVVAALRAWLLTVRVRIRQRALRRLRSETLPQAILQASLRLPPLLSLAGMVALSALIYGQLDLGVSLFVLSVFIGSVPGLYFIETVPRGAAVVAASLQRRGVCFPSAATFYEVASDTRVVITETFFSRAAPPRLLRVHALGELSKKHLLGLAAKVSEDHPSHQLAQTSAIATAPTGAVRLRRSKFIPGYGFDAMTSDGQRVLVGTRRLLHENGVSIAKASSDVTIAASQGHVLHFIAINDSLEGMLVLVDNPSPGSRAAVHRLMDAHTAVTFVTGRMLPTAKTLGNALDLTDVRADLRSDEQASLVREFSRAGERVCVIGEPFDATPLWEHANSAVVLGEARPILPVTRNQVGVDGTDPRVAAAAVWLPRQFLWHVRRTSRVVVAVSLAMLAVAALGPYWLAPLALLLVEVVAAERTRRFGQQLLSGLPPIETEPVLIVGE